MTHCESLQSIRILGFRTEKRYFYYKVDRNWYEGCRQTPWRQRMTTGSTIIIKIFYNNSTFHVLRLNRAKSVRVSSIQLLNHISPGLQEENAVLKKWQNISFLWHRDTTSNPSVCITHPGDLHNSKDEDEDHGYCFLKILLNFEQKPTEK